MKQLLTIAQHESRMTLLGSLAMLRAGFLEYGDRFDDPEDCDERLVNLEGASSK